MLAAEVDRDHALVAAAGQGHEAEAAADAPGAAVRVVVQAAQNPGTSWQIYV